MRITTTLDLTADEESELSNILGVDRSKLAQTLSGYASAAIREYVTVFLGQKVFPRGSGLLEYRLLLLIQNVLGNRIPTEERVNGLFQTTPSESRSLIRSVMSKYHVQLRDAIETSMREVLGSVSPDDEGTAFTVVVNSLNVIEELNRTLAEIDGNLPSVRKKRGSVSTYIIEGSSYARLCERLDIKPVARTGDE